MAQLRQYLINLVRAYPHYFNAANLLDWAVTLLLGFTFFYTVASLGGTRESVLNKVSLLVGALVVLHAFWWRIASRHGCRLDWRPALMLPFLVFGWISAFWISPWEWSGVGEMLQWTLAAAFLWVAVHHPRDRNKLWVFLFAVIAALMFSCYWAFHQRFLAVVTPWVAGPSLVLEELPRQVVPRIQAEQFLGRSSGTLGSPNNFAGLLLMVIPSLLVGAFLNRFSVVVRVLLGYCAVIGCVALYLSVSRAGILCLLAVFILVPLFAMDTWKRRLLAYLIGGIFLGYTGVLLYNADTRLRERFEQIVSSDANGDLRFSSEWSRPFLWRAATKIWEDEPVRGAGAGAFDHAIEKHRPPELQNQAVYVHNDYLNVLSDYGVLGLLLFILPGGMLFFWAFYRWWFIPKKIKESGFDERSPSGRVIIGGSLLSLVAVWAHTGVDFHFKIPALLFLMAVHVGLILRSLPLSAVGKSNKPHPAWLRHAYFALFFFGGLQLAWQGWRIYEAERLVFVGREFLRGSIIHNKPNLRSEKLRAALVHQFSRAAAWNPENPQAWAYRGLALVQLNRDYPKNYEQLGQSALEASRRALDLSQDVWFFHVVEGMALQLMGRPFDEMIAPFKRAAEIAPNNALALCYLAQALAMDDFERINALVVVKRVLELDPTNETALNLRSNLQQP